MNNYIDGKEFRDITADLEPGEYEDCTFVNAVVGNLNGLVLVDCSFIDCDLSNASMINTTLNGVEFSNCKMIGLRFETCNEYLFSVNFDGCNLSLCSFFQRNLQNSRFVSCNLSEADFTESNCSRVKFERCDMRNVVFENTRLEHTDFYSSEGFTLDPDKNILSKSIFSAQNALGLLGKFDIDIRN